MGSFAAQIVNTPYFLLRQMKKRVGGIGIMMKNKYTYAIKNVKKISSRILSISFNTNPTLTIVCVYSPTDKADNKTKDEFYDLLEDHINSIPAHDFLIIAGDFNARLGTDKHKQIPNTIGKYLFHDETNDNGERLSEFCLNTSLKPSQSLFPQPKGRQWTWMSPNETKAQIDHILIRHKWINSIRNYRSFSTVYLQS
jgi:hypothetical protein